MRTHFETADDHRPVAMIIQDAVGNLQEIIRSEVQLAKAEIREETAKAVRAGLLLVAGAVLALYGLGFLLAAGMSGLALFMPVWGAAGVIAVVLLAAGGGLLTTGRSRMRGIHPAPEKTIRTLKEDAQWLRDQMK